MKDSKEFKIGIFVLVVLLLSFFVINFLRGKDIFNREISLSAQYETVDGLLPAAPVFIRGFKAGSVTEVNYDRELDLFVVECSVKKEFIIPKDSKMVIYSTDIMGGKGVRIDLGRSKKEAQNKSELIGDIEKDLIASLTDSVTPVMNSLVEVMMNAKSLLTNINSVLSDENKANLSSTLLSAKKTMSNMDKLSASMKNKSPELEKIISNLSILTGKLSLIMDSVDSTVADINQVTTSLKESDIFELVSNINSLVESIQDPNGVFGKMMSDDKIYNSVDSLVCNINNLVEKIQENPKKYMKLSIF